MVILKAMTLVPQRNIAPLAWDSALEPGTPR